MALFIGLGKKGILAVRSPRGNLNALLLRTFPVFLLMVRRLRKYSDGDGRQNSRRERMHTPTAPTMHRSPTAKIPKPSIIQRDCLSFFEELLDFGLWRIHKALDPNKHL
jgi:hypothetical protein